MIRISLAALALIGLLSTARARAQVLAEFAVPAGSWPVSIVAGPDGAMWFVEEGLHRVARITPLGVVTEFGAGITAFANPGGITVGPDGNLWFTETAVARIGRITPLGVVTEFGAGISAFSNPAGIAAGPDGNLWFTEALGNRIGRITPAGVVTEFGAGLTPAATPSQIVAGPDGNLWFTEASAGKIARITPSGVVTEFSAGITPLSQPVGIAAGADGNLWFTEVAGNRIGRITTAGVVTEFGAGITPGSQPIGIAAGPDGNLWFVEMATGTIGRITPAGVVTEFPGFKAGPGVSENAAVAAGPDGNVWVGAISYAGTVGDAIGRMPTAPDAATTFHPATPCRVLDTRLSASALGGPSLAAGARRDFTVLGACGIPAGATSLSANVTVTRAAAAGTVSTAPDLFPVVAFQPGQTRANNAMLRFAMAGSGVLSFTNDMPSGTVDLVVDVNGWWQ
jgi:streptogramin lyase